MMTTLDDATWRTSSYTNSGETCVEVAALGTTRAVRDSKDSTGPALRFTTAEWSAFTTGVRTGEFD